MTKSLVIFASGSGSNAEFICNYFSTREEIKVEAIFTNNANAGVIQRMKNSDIPVIVFSNEKDIHHLLNSISPDLIVLAGYLKLISLRLIENFPNKIINIHPALLPKYGGKGMYGMNVHEAVKENSELETGITIHFVNESYDEGKHILQVKTSIDTEDDPQTIANKVHQLEYRHYAPTIEVILSEQD